MECLIDHCIEITAVLGTQALCSLFFYRKYKKEVLYTSMLQDQHKQNMGIIGIIQKKNENKKRKLKRLNTILRQKKLVPSRLSTDRKLNMTLDEISKWKRTQNVDKFILINKQKL